MDEARPMALLAGEAPATSADISLIVTACGGLAADALERSLARARAQECAGLEILCVCAPAALDADRALAEAAAALDARVRVVPCGANAAGITDVDGGEGAGTGADAREAAGTGADAGEAAPARAGSGANLLAARAAGIRAARGRYLMFLDAGDELAAGACAAALGAIERAGVDLMPFGVRLVGGADTDARRLGQARAQLAPPLERLVAEPGLGLVGRLYRAGAPVLFNKVYRAGLCRRALGMAGEPGAGWADDLYLSVLIARCAESCQGLADELYLRDCSAAGFLASGGVALSAFDEALGTARAAKALERFAAAQDAAGVALDAEGVPAGRATAGPVEGGASTGRCGAEATAALRAPTQVEEGAVGGGSVEPVQPSEAAEPAGPGKLSCAVRDLSRRLLGWCADLWCTALEPGCRSAGLEHLVDAWGLAAALGALAKQREASHVLVLQAARESARFQPVERSGALERSRAAASARPVVEASGAPAAGAGPGQPDAPAPSGAPNSPAPRSIALYYRRIAGGGAERVVAELSGLLARALDAAGHPRYRVVLVTDDAPREDEFRLDPLVRRAYLPAARAADPEGYRPRLEAWRRVIDEYELDAVISGQWFNPYTMWDALAVKGHARRPAFAMHQHNLAARVYGFADRSALKLVNLYRLCDGVVVLSEADRAFAARFCGNVHLINNPVGYLRDAAVRQGLREEGAICWVGRIAKEKQPLEMVCAMEHVVRELPGARLYLVGDGPEPLVDEVAAAVEARGLGANVRLVGYDLDVWRWYERAQVVAVTSKVEGFMLVVGEALASQTPVVMYDLPWLTFVKDGRGIRTVPPGRPDLLAAELVRLLRNPDEARELGRAGRAQVEELAADDVAARWQAVLEAAWAGGAGPVEDPDGRTQIELLTEYQQQAKDGFRRQRNRARAEARRLEGELAKERHEVRRLQGELAAERARAEAAERRVARLRGSRSLRLGRALTWLPRTLKRQCTRLFRRLRKG